MGAYIIRRLAWLPLILLAVSFATFTLARFGPGDPVSVAAGQIRDPEVLEQVRAERGLDGLLILDRRLGPARFADPQMALLGQRLGEALRELRRHVLHHQHRQREVGRQQRQHLRQRLRAAGADADLVAQIEIANSIKKLPTSAVLTMQALMCGKRSSTG